MNTPSHLPRYGRVPRRDLPTPAYVAAVTQAGFRNAIGPEMPVASAHVLLNAQVPGRVFLRREGCSMHLALTLLLRDLTAAKKRGRRA